MSRSELPSTFEEYVVARRPSLLRTAYLLVGNLADAEDLVQTALIKAVSKWRRIQDDPDPYVRKILVNENISRHRGRRWRETPVDVLPERGGAGRSDPDGDVPDDLDLRRAIAALAPRQRAVVVLRYFDDLTEAQTAHALGISVGTVKSQARDALVRLRAATGGVLSDR